MSWLTDRLARCGTPRPYAVVDLARELGIGQHDPKLTSKLALALGLNRGWVLRCRHLGLTVWQAEAWAMRAGLNPVCVWPAWGDELPEPCCDDWECAGHHEEAR